MKKLFMITMALILAINTYSEETSANKRLEELEAQLQRLQESEVIERRDMEKDESKEYNENNQRVIAERSSVTPTEDGEVSGTNANGEVIYYYLPPEIKVTNEERARVIGRVRDRMRQQELNEKIASGKVTLEEIVEEEEAKAKAEAEATLAKLEEEAQKRMERDEKDRRIREIEKTLGITDKERQEWEEFNKMSEEMQEIMRRQRELDEKYFNGSRL